MDARERARIGVGGRYVPQAGLEPHLLSGDSGSAEMNLKLPGLPLHVRLGAPTKDELTLFEQRKIVRRLNAVGPAEYGVTL